MVAIFLSEAFFVAWSAFFNRLISFCLFFSNLSNAFSLSFCSFNSANLSFWTACCSFIFSFWIVSDAFSTLFNSLIASVVFWTLWIVFWSSLFTIFCWAFATSTNPFSKSSKAFNNNFASSVVLDITSGPNISLFSILAIFNCI